MRRISTFKYCREEITLPQYIDEDKRATFVPPSTHDGMSSSQPAWLDSSNRSTIAWYTRLMGSYSDPAGGYVVGVPSGSGGGDMGMILTFPPAKRPQLPLQPHAIATPRLFALSTFAAAAFSGSCEVGVASAR